MTADRERIEREARSLTSYVDGWCPANVRDVLAERIAARIAREVERALQGSDDLPGGRYAVEVRRYSRERFSGGEWRLLCGPGSRSEYSCPSDLEAWPERMVDDDPMGKSFKLKRYDTPEAAAEAGRAAVLTGGPEKSPTEFRVVRLDPELEQPKPRSVKRWRPKLTGVAGACEASIAERRRLTAEASDTRRKKDVERLRALEEESAAIRARSAQGGG